MNDKSGKITSGESDSKRVCKRCLLSQIDQAELLKQVREGIDRLPAADKVSDIQYEARLAVCKQCDYLENGTCKACGCYVELRAAAKAGRCPYRKWT